MENNSFLASLAERFGQTASVKNVYGEPISSQGRTIIPVAQIAMGLGGGHGNKNKQKNSVNVEQASDNKGEAAGAGGGLYATAKGVYEVTDKCTRFIPANATRQLIAIATLSFVVGRWIGGRRMKGQLYKRLKV